MCDRLAPLTRRDLRVRWLAVGAAVCVGSCAGGKECVPGASPAG